MQPSEQCCQQAPRIGPAPYEKLHHLAYRLLFAALDVVEDSLEAAKLTQCRTCVP